MCDEMKRMNVYFIMTFLCVCFSYSEEIYCARLPRYTLQTLNKKVIIIIKTELFSTAQIFTVKNISIHFYF